MSTQGDYSEQTKRKFTDQEIRLSVKLLKAMCAEEDEDMLQDLIDSVVEAQENFNYNMDAILKGLKDD